MSTIVPEAFRRFYWYVTDRDWRARYRATRKRIRRLGKAQRRAFSRLWTQTGGRIVSGPFHGLRYPPPSRSRVFPQKLLGTYEKELWPIVEEIVSREYRLIVDIGAAEGYYVCGLASRLPHAVVTAFEAQTDYHPVLSQIAKQNGLDGRISVRGYCQSEDLRAVIADERSVLLVCDVEGAEADLLDIDRTPELRHVDILVEVHEHLRPGVRQTLFDRFGSTHAIQSVAGVARTLADFPSGVRLDRALALAAMEESRGDAVEWLWMTTTRPTID